MTRDKIFFGYIRVLRDTHRAICYERGDHHDEVETAYSVGADAIEKSRAPTTLDEALRDYAMFGKFVAGAPEIFTPEQLAGFVGDWLRKTHPSEYVAFVKEELKPVIKSDSRPEGCRFRLQDEGKPYPRSSCQACGKGVMSGLGRACVKEPTNDR